MAEIINQIYATHCTYGNSAIERREGELADRVLGYSARAGSFSQFDLRKYFRTIERYLYYQLPKDVSAEAKLEFTQATAPTRMVFCPEISGLQVLAHICYRQRDVANRAGSYFAHVLLQPVDANVPQWSAADCLKLWGCPAWVCEDAPSLPFELPKFVDLNEFAGGYTAPVSDDITYRFFTEEGYCPPSLAGNTHALNRWGKVDLAARQNLLKNAVRGFLEVARKTRRSLLLVIEPEAAVLFFYALARLFPEKMTRDLLSLSTYEPFPDRLPTAMAGTHFCRNERHDLSPDEYRTGNVLNSFSERFSDHWDPRTADFADELVDRFVENGWESVDQTNHRYEAAGAERVEQFIELHHARNVAEVILNPSQTLPADSTNVSALSQRFMARHILRHFSDDVSGQHVFDKLGESAAHLFAALRVTAGEPETSSDKRMRQVLIKVIPEKDFAEFLKLDIPAADKLTALRLFVVKHGRLPVGLEGFWSATASPHALRRDPALAELPLSLLRQLKPATIETLRRSTEKKDRLAFTLALTRAINSDDFERDNILEKAVSMLDPPQAFCLVQHLGTSVAQLSRVTRDRLAVHLGKIVSQFPHDPLEALKKLDTLKAARSILGNATAKRLEGWLCLRLRLLEAERRRSRPRGLTRRPQRLTAAQRDAIGEELAPHIQNAFGLSRSTWEREVEGGGQDDIQRAVACLRTVSDALECDSSIFPDEMERKLANYIESGYFADVIQKARFGTRVKARDRIRRRRDLRPVIYATAISIGLAAICVAVFVRPWEGFMRQRSVAVRHDENQKKMPEDVNTESEPGRKYDTARREPSRATGLERGAEAEASSDKYDPPAARNAKSSEPVRGDDAPLTGEGKRNPSARRAHSDAAAQKESAPASSDEVEGTNTPQSLEDPRQEQTDEPETHSGPTTRSTSRSTSDSTMPFTDSENDGKSNGVDSNQSDKGRIQPAQVKDRTEQTGNRTILARRPSRKDEGDKWLIKELKLKEGQSVANIYSIEGCWKTKFTPPRKWEVFRSDDKRVARVVISNEGAKHKPDYMIKILLDEVDPPTKELLKNSVIHVADKDSPESRPHFVALRDPTISLSPNLHTIQDVKSHFEIPPNAPLLRKSGKDVEFQSVPQDCIPPDQLHDIWFPIDINIADVKYRVLIQVTKKQQGSAW